MQLRSPDGASVDLRITGYQFPGKWAKVGSPPSWEWAGDRESANWLQIGGHITLADGKTWAFEDPCLTTWDALELGSWLREVAAGTVPPSPDAGGEPEGLLDFLEPNLAFSVEGRTADRVQIRIHFSLESVPPWLKTPTQNLTCSSTSCAWRYPPKSSPGQPSRGCWSWRSFPSASSQRQASRARSEPAGPDAGRSAARCGHPFSQPRLTAMVTATAATNGKRRRSAAPMDTIRCAANWGYVRPEKRTVGTNTANAATVANTVAKPLDNA